MKKFLFLLCLFIPLRIYAISSSRTLYPGNVVNLSGPGNNWNNPTNAEVEDGVVTSTSAGGFDTNMLRFSNFGFTIPYGSTIQGILVEVKENENSHITDKSVVLFDANASSATSADRANVITEWPTPLAYISYGGSNDMWNENFQASDINNSNFGFGISAQKNAGGLQIAEIDVGRITVYYSIVTNIYNAKIYNATIH